MPKTNRTPWKSRGGRSSSRGSALPAILSLSVGVGALASGFAVQTHREHDRARFDRDRSQAYLDAWAQMEVVTDIVNSSPYDAGTGQNVALTQAAARGDRQFIDHDGYPTGVICEQDGPAAGFYRLTSTANIRDARCRITALVRSRQSFADFDYFVNSHDMGISGGLDASSRHIDAPDGDIHSNKKLLFYFPDRHFIKPVTAVEGFSFVSGAVGPADPDGNPRNNWMWGPTNDAANAVSGLTTVDLTTFGARADNVLNLDGPWDYAKVKLKGATARVEHWQKGHNETQTVTQMQEQFHTEYVQQEKLKKVTTTTQVTVPVYQDQQVWVYGPVATQTLVSAAWTETVSDTRTVATQVWVDGGGGGATGGGGGSGGVGYWQTVYVEEPYTYTVNHPAVYNTTWSNQWHWETQRVQTGTTTQNQTVTSWVSYSPPQYNTVAVQVSDGFVPVEVQQTVWIPDTRVQTVDVAATGTIFVNGRVEFLPMSTGSDGFDVQTLDGSLTIASNDNVRIRESIVYAKKDASNVWQKAYLNGNDRTKEFIPNPDYKGSSVLGIIAKNDVEIWGDVPDQAEIDGTLMARDGEFRARGINVASNGTVSTTSGGFVKMSLRRLGGVISNQRPVTTYVDSSNAVTRGFVYTKSVYDTRQRTNPPRGFPTLNRPKVLATLIREIN